MRYFPSEDDWIIFAFRIGCFGYGSYMTVDVEKSNRTLSSAETNIKKSLLFFVTEIALMLGSFSELVNFVV